MDPITTTSTGLNAAAKASTNAFSALTSEEFVKIMFSELSNQDPLKPNDSNQLVQQMANLRSIESDLQLQNRLESLVTQNQLAAAGSMIGARISGLSEDNRRVEGIVQRIAQTKDGPVLTLTTGTRVRFSNLDEIADPRDFINPPAPTPGPTPNPAPAPSPSPAPYRDDSVLNPRPVLGQVAPIVVGGTGSKRPATGAASGVVQPLPGSGVADPDASRW